MEAVITPPKSILRKVGKAIADFDMIREGDRILLGVSGGKDSLSLLHVLSHLKTYAPIQFTLGVVTVDPQINGYNPGKLARYFKMMDIPWHYEQQAILEEAGKHMDGDSFCSYCSRMKRGIMYSCCRREGYNLLALAQHLDDLAESLLMSVFYGGRLRTMKAHYINNDGDIRIIRPLVYVRETMTAAFAQDAALPVIADSCPSCFSAPAKRQQMKELLSELEQENKHLFSNMLTAMRPLLTERL